MLREEEALDHALALLGSLLEARGLGYEIVVIGGSALLLLGVIRRPTRDLDVLAVVRHGQYASARPLPPDLERAARDVAAELRLAPDWLNSGPTDQLISGLPEGFQERVETRTYRTLVVHVASRLDQIYLKLFAVVDHWPSHDKHFYDLRDLRPTPKELREAARWVRGQDVGPDFPGLVADVLRAFGVENDDAQS